MVQGKPKNIRKKAKFFNCAEDAAWYMKSNYLLVLCLWKCDRYEMRAVNSNEGFGGIGRFCTDWSHYSGKVPLHISLRCVFLVHYMHHC